MHPVCALLRMSLDALLPAEHFNLAEEDRMFSGHDTELGISDGSINDDLALEKDGFCGGELLVRRHRHGRDLPTILFCSLLPFLLLLNLVIDNQDRDHSDESNEDPEAYSTARNTFTLVGLAALTSEFKFSFMLTPLVAPVKLFELSVIGPSVLVLLPIVIAPVVVASIVVAPVVMIMVMMMDILVLSIVVVIVLGGGGATTSIVGRVRLFVRVFRALFDNLISIPIVVVASTTSIVNFLNTVPVRVILVVRVVLLGVVIFVDDLVWLPGSIVSILEVVKVGVGVVSSSHAKNDHDSRQRKALQDFPHLSALFYLINYNLRSKEPP